MAVLISAPGGGDQTAAAGNEAAVVVTPDHFREVLPIVRPQVALLTSGVASVGRHTFSELGGLGQAIALLKASVVMGLEEESRFAQLGVSPPTGVLLYGPSGCGKTALGLALAQSTHATFIPVNGAEVVHKVVGESEKAIAQVFARARAAAPAILFIDQIDMLARPRGADSSAERTMDRLLSCLLMEMDGITAKTTPGGGAAEGRPPVMVVATTESKALIDPALLRPGRLSIHIHLPLPDPAARLEILERKLAGLPAQQLSRDDREWLVGSTPGWSGADLDNLCREAALYALRHDITALHVERGHFEAALQLLQRNAATA